MTAETVRRWGGRLLLAGASTVAALALAEVGLRLSTEPPAGLFTMTEREFERLPGIFQPGQSVELQPGTEFAHTVRIDSLGYRGTDFPRSRPADEVRIFYAGDSFTWGHNLDHGSTLPAQLEGRLSDRCGPSRVINAGLSGSTILAQEALITRGLALEPDLVILMFHENDIEELIHVRMWEQLARNRRLKSRFPLSLVYSGLKRSRLWDQAQHLWRVYRFRSGADVEQGVRTLAPEAQEDAGPARAEYQRRLDALAGLLQERGVSFLFVAFPHPNSVMEGAGGPHYDWALDTARALGLPTVDLLATLLEVGVPPEDAFLLPRDYHPSGVGNAIAADRIAEVLLRDLLDHVCGS